MFTLKPDPGMRVKKYISLAACGTFRRLYEKFAYAQAHYFAPQKQNT